MKSLCSRKIFLFFYFILLFFYLGCSDSGLSSQKDSNVKILSGLVQKGQFLNGAITGQYLNEKGIPSGNIVQSTINSLGAYELNTTKEGLLFLTAKGQFFDEYKGKKSSDEAELYVLIKLSKNKETRKINLNLFTSLESKRILKLLQDGEGYEEAINMVKASLEKNFAFPKTVEASKLDIYDMNGSLKEENKNLLLFSALLLESMDAISTGDLVEKFSLNQLKTFINDYEDDASFNGASLPIWKKIRESDKQLLWNHVIEQLELEKFNPSLPEKIWEIELNNPILINPINVTPLSIFKLKSVTLGNEVTPYVNQTAIFIGPEGSTASLTFEFNSTIVDNNTYKLVASSLGQNDLTLTQNISLVNNTANIEVPLNSTLRNFIKDSYANNRDLEFKAIVRNVINPSFRTISSPILGTLSEKIEPHTETTQVSYRGLCQGALANNAHAQLDIEGSFYNTEVTYNNVCVSLDYNSSTKKFDASLVQGEQGILAQAIEQTIGGHEVLISTTSITASQLNIDKIILKLPKEHSIHGFDGQHNVVSFRGENNITLSNPVGNKILHTTDLNQLSLTGQLNEKYLHAKNLPFYWKLADYELTVDGLYLKKSFPVYVFEYANRYRNNTERFKSPKGLVSNLLLTKTGVNTTNASTIAFGGEKNLKMHYPYLYVDSGSFEVKVNNSKIISAQTEADMKIKSNYDSTCHLMNCAEGSQVGQIVIDQILETKLYANGSTLSEQKAKIGLVEWGNKQQVSVFSRNSDRGAFVYIPGFELPTNQANEVNSYLLGTIEDHPLAASYRKNSDSASRAGRHWFAGINVGKEIIDGLDNSASRGVGLEGSKMNIALGESLELNQELESNNYTKYYIRPSGVTGVFNRRPDSFSKRIYGYDMQFSQFSFRQIANDIDEFTLIDGLIDVPNKGNFTVAFNSLGLDCRGGLNQGAIVPCDASKVDAPNCTEQLSAWKIATKFSSVGFDGGRENVCSLNKELEVGHVLDVIALKDKLGMTSKWSAAGVPSSSSINSSSFNQLDGNLSKNSEQSNGGYQIAFEEGIGLHSTQSGSSGQDWLESNVTLGLPFWERADMSLRLQNKTLTRQETSVVTSKGDLPQFNMEETNSVLAQKLIKDYKFDAQYNWAGGLINFRLPIYYNAHSKATETPRFLGRTSKTDLKVIELKSGIDYITPNETSMSFGASADFEAMGNLKLHVDLNDPNSLKEIDEALEEYAGIKGKPLTKTIGVVVENIRLGNKLLGEGTSLSLERGAIYALEELGKRAGEDDPFLKLSNILSKVHAFPAVVNDRVESEVKGAIFGAFNKSFSDLENFLKNPAQNITYAQFAQNNASQLDAVIDGFKTVDKGIQEYERTFDFLNDIKAEINRVDQVNDYITEINSTIMKYFKPKNGSCSWDYTTNQEFFKPIGQVDKVIKEVNKKLQAIKIAEIKTLSKQVNNFTGIDSKDLVVLAEKIKKMSQDLNKLVNDKTGLFHTKFETHICNNVNEIHSKMMEVVSKAQEVITIKNELIRSIEDIEDELKSNGEIGKNVYALKSFSKKVQKEVLRMKNNNDTMAGDIANLLIVKILLEIKENNSTNPLVQNVTENTNDGLQIVHEILVTGVNNKLDVYVFDKNKILVLDLQDKIPNLSASDMRKLLVTKLFETEGMKALNREFHAMIQPIADEVNKVAMSLLGGIDRAVNQLLAKVSDKINKVLSKATATMKNNMPVQAAKIDGYAIIQGQRLSQAHIGSEFKIKGDDKKTSFSLNAALDIWSDDINDSTGCVARGTQGNLNIQISTRDITMPLGEQNVKVDLVLLGLTVDPQGSPVGIFGAIASKGGFNFDTLKLYNLGLATGIGVEETYLAAKASGKLDDVQLGVDFIVGRVCNQEVIKTFIPDSIEEFITVPRIFKGALVYGEAQIPVWKNGCTLTLNVRAKVGVWYLLGLTAQESADNKATSDTFGGLVGGGAFGKGLCIATLGGEIMVLADKTGDRVRFQGSGWGAAGVGSCDNSWSSVKKSRQDDWCGTGDAQFKARYDNAWEVLDASFSAVH